MFSVPLLELTFPASGLPFGVDVEKVTSEAEELLSGNCFGVQSQLSLNVEPSMEPAALDHGIWPQSF
jgi:hypothetical protein